MKGQGKGIFFRKDNILTLKIYTNANYVSSDIDKKSTLRYCMFLGESRVTWRSKKQDRVSLSSVEAEFLPLALQEVLCIMIEQNMWKLIRGALNSNLELN